MDIRKNVKVVPKIKDMITEIKKRHNFKTEEQAIAYMYFVNSWAFEKMPTKTYYDALKLARESVKQVDFMEIIKND